MRPVILEWDVVGRDRVNAALCVVVHIRSCRGPAVVEREPGQEPGLSARRPTRSIFDATLAVGPTRLHAPRPARIARKLRSARAISAA